MWKDIRYKFSEPSILECNGGVENHFTNKGHCTKTAIPSGLGIRERYLEIIEQGLAIWTAYLIERERIEALSEAQRNNPPPVLPDNLPTTKRIGTLSARRGIHPRNLVNHLAREICSNLHTQVFDYDNNDSLAYLEFWQRVTLNLPPEYLGYHDWRGITPEFKEFIGGLAWKVGDNDSAMLDWADVMPAFIAEHNVQLDGKNYLKSPLSCWWDEMAYLNLGQQLQRPENDDSDA